MANENTDAKLTEEEEREISETIVITEQGEEPYKIKDSRLVFTILFNEEDEKTSVSGAIETEAFIENTNLDKIETWRFVISDARISKADVDAVTNRMKYYFAADNIEVKE